MTYAFAFHSARRAAMLPRALARAVAAPSRVVHTRAGVAVALVRCGSDTEARRVAAELRERVAEDIGDPELSSGLGGPRDDERSLRSVALDAEHALRIGRALNGPGRVTAYRDLGPYCFVLGRPTAEIRSFARDVLGPLAEDGQREELRTLEEFLRCHGSVNGVARALFLHRNTVRQRLKRISALIGADLEDAETRMSLYLAVLGHNALLELAS